MQTRQLLLEEYDKVLRDNNESFNIAVITNSKARVGGILLVGMNPSKDDGAPEYDYLEDCWGGNFWNPKHKMMGSNPDMVNVKDRIGGYDMHCGYIDLFPLRGSKLDKIICYNTDKNRMMGQLLSVTQDYIEALRPKLIIFANRKDCYYWGDFYKKAESVRVAQQDSWMGYQLYRQTSPLEGNQEKGRWEYYKIEGIAPSGVNRYKNETNLKGSYFLHYRQHSAKCGVVPPSQELTSSDIECILNSISPDLAKSLL